jgi:hypothetical protein
MGPPRPLPRLARRGRALGHPKAMRQLAALATQAAIQAEEEAAWQAHQHTTTAAPAKRSRVA